MRRLSYSIVSVLLLFTVPSCFSSYSDNLISNVKGILSSNKIFTEETESAEIFIISEDLSCDLCFQSVSYYLNKLPVEDRFIVLVSDSKKLSYEQTLFADIVKEENLHIISDFSMIDYMSEITANIKGPYMVSLEAGEIVNVEVVE